MTVCVKDRRERFGEVKSIRVEENRGEQVTVTRAGTGMAKNQRARLAACRSADRAGAVGEIVGGQVECTAAGVKVEFKRVGLDKGGHWEVSGDVKE